MSLKSVTLLEEAYRHILGDLEIAFNALLEDSESEYQCSLVAANPYTSRFKSHTLYMNKIPVNIIFF